MADPNGPLRPMRPIKRTPFVEEILPVHGTPELAGDGDKPTHKHPCRGYGMNTKERAAAYAHKFKELQREWPHLSPDQRYTQIHTLANEQLAADGVPKVKIVQSTEPGTVGTLHPDSWELHVDGTLIQSHDLTPDRARSLAGVVYHETRHAEQWYLVARAKAAHLQATTRLTPSQQIDEIRREIQVPHYVAESAQKKPLPHDSPQSACAKALYDSIDGKNWGHRIRTISRQSAVDTVLPAAQAKADAAEAAFNRIAPNFPDGTLSPAQNTALDEMNNALNYAGRLEREQPLLYQAYLGLPEEFDATDSETKVIKAWHL